MIRETNRLQKVFPQGIPDIAYSEASDVNLYDKNCENILGFVHIPVGIAGPFLISGDYADGEYRLPLATTEACLVASVHRGSKALRMAGGCTVSVENIGISRAPVFRVEDPKSEQEYMHILDGLLGEMQESLTEISRHTKLVRYDLAVRENYVYVRFWFHTGEAMGMNMVTIASKFLADRYLEQAFSGKLVATSSNWCSDKKASHDNAELGRKYHVAARVILTDEVLHSLRVTADSMMDVYHAKIQGGAELSGGLGRNAHHANIVAAVYAATGQDLAHVVEGSLGKTMLQRVRDGIEVVVELPAVVCGTLGGGTKLPLQSQFKNIIGLEQELRNGEQSMEFAEVLAAGVLAGEISLLAAICEKRLASSHDQFRR